MSEVPYENLDPEVEKILRAEFGEPRDIYNKYGAQYFTQIVRAREETVAVTYEKKKEKKVEETEKRVALRARVARLIREAREEAVNPSSLRSNLFQV